MKDEGVGRIAARHSIGSPCRLSGDNVIELDGRMAVRRIEGIWTDQGKTEAYSFARIRGIRADDLAPGHVAFETWSVAAFGVAVAPRKMEGNGPDGGQQRGGCIVTGAVTSGEGGLQMPCGWVLTGWKCTGQRRERIKQGKNSRGLVSYGIGYGCALVQSPLDRRDQLQNGCGFDHRYSSSHCKTATVWAMRSPCSKAA